MEKSKLKWRIVYAAYCVLATLISMPVLILFLAVRPLGWIVDKVGDFKWYLVRKYKPSN